MGSGQTFSLFGTVSPNTALTRHAQLDAKGYGVGGDSTRRAAGGRGCLRCTVGRQPVPGNAGAAFPVAALSVHSAVGSSPMGETGKLLAMFVLSDFAFYWSHRLLHVPFFYARYHKLHHSHVAPIPWTALYVHPGEFLLAFFGIFVGPVVSMTRLCGRVSWVTLTLFWSGLMVAMVASHSGLYTVGAEHHEAHHVSRKGNFGASVGFMDRLCGTAIDAATVL
jgi:sterol desaturase/sphingolipid hydroxylase (fatty acid hydroxylase superfamily)